MKVKGLVLTLPVCDWRPLLDPQLRIAHFSKSPPGDVRRSKLFLRGFGPVKPRFKIRIPWSATDTLYFNCARAVSLPDRLPRDRARVKTYLRRVYLDFGTLVRFEIGMFSSPRLHSPPSVGRLDEFAREFWSLPVTTFAQNRRQSSTPPTLHGAESKSPHTARPHELHSVSSLAPYLVERFLRATSRHADQQNLIIDHCTALGPLIQVLVEISPDDPIDEAWPLDRDETTWLRLEALPLSGALVDIMYLGYKPTVRHRWIREIRASLAWLHAQLYLLTHLLDAELDAKSPADAKTRALNEIIRLAKDLESAKAEIDAHQLGLHAVLKLFEEFHGPLLSRLRWRLTRPDLPKDLADRLTELLSKPVITKPGSVQSIEMQLNTIQGDKVANLVSQIAIVEKSVADIELQIARSQPNPPVNFLRTKEHLTEVLKLMYEALAVARKDFRTDGD